jgi:hypothetical protein
MARATGEFIVHTYKEFVIRESDGAFCMLVEITGSEGNLLGAHVVVADELAELEGEGD